jgi:enoyl-CoA hydratase
VAVHTVGIERRGPVGWVLIGDHQASVEAAYGNEDDYIGIHAGIGIALDEFRWDPEIRIIVITGRNDGEFYRFARRPHWDDPKFRSRLNPLKPQKSETGGVNRVPSAHEVLNLMEKPVIARVNGDAIGFGMSLLWGCDFIIAREDALVAWGHTGLGEIIDSNGEERGFPFDMTPSYGTVMTKFMTPAKAKEFMMLSPTYTGRELADMNVFNYAVPAGELDAKVDDIIARLLRRSPAVLARTKKLVNKELAIQYALTEDLSNAYAGLDVYRIAASGEMD